MVKNINPDHVLVYLPNHTWSMRYGTGFFTVNIKSYQVIDRSYAVYEIYIRNGKSCWSALRRFSAFDQLLTRLQLRGWKKLPSLPPKTWCCRDLNPEYLDSRLQQLQKFLDQLLHIPLVSQEKYLQQFLEFHYEDKEVQED